MALDDEEQVTIRSAIAELSNEHRPQWVAKGENSAVGYGYTTEPREDFDPVGCVICYPQDGSWPCTSALVVNDLISLLPGQKRYNETLSDALDDGVIM